MRAVAAAGVGALGLGAILLMGGETAQVDVLPATPTLRGWGATAFEECWGLPLRIRQVTNTDDSGTGSLRSVLETVAHQDTFDIVTFRTGGLIVGQSPLTATTRGRCIRIAGQTATGDGITYTGHRFRLGAQLNKCRGAGVEYMRFRKNLSTTFWCDEAYVRHVSGAWTGSAGTGGDDVLEFGRADQLTDLYTIADNLLYEPHVEHATVLHVSAGRASVYRNVMCFAGYRCPMVQTHPDGGAEVVHNAVYNWLGGANAISGVNSHVLDIVHNYTKPGPATVTQTAWRRHSFFFRSQCTTLGAGNCTASNLIEGNLTVESGYEPLFPDSLAWRGPERQYVWQHTDVNAWNPSGGEDGADVPLTYRRTITLPERLGFDADWPYARPIMTPALLDEVLETAGTYRGLACDGTWVARRDSLDAAKIQELRDSTGLSDHITWTPAAPTNPSTFPVVPTPAAGTPCQDTTGDGIPDAWYQRWGWNPSSPPPVDSTLVSGYPLAWAYLDNFDPADPTPWDPEPVPPAPTFSNDRWFYVTGTIVVPGPLGGTDIIPDTTVVPRGRQRSAILNEARDSALVMTCEPHGVPLDSLSVNQRIVAWARDGIPNAAYLRNRHLPGAPC